MGMGADTDANAYATLLEAFEAAGAETGVLYVTVPITSGRRELALMRELSCSRTELREGFRDRWLEEVVRPNEEDAHLYATQARVSFPGRIVVDPSRIHVTDWTQDDFDKLWTAVIERYTRAVVITPGWAYSRGARHEVGLALSIGLPLSDPWGKVLEISDLGSMIQSAESELRREGWTSEMLREYLPPVPHLDWVDGQPRRLHEEPSRNDAPVEAFAWLLAERRYQVRKFGTSLDDEHTVEGLSQDGWWWRQLTNYFHRADVLELGNPLGRQALAKFTATACGLLESTIRVFGPLPPPGVPSGELGGAFPVSGSTT